MKSLFSLDPAITFLNHGSFGATPLPLQALQRDWQARLERQPVAFLSRELPALLADVRQALGDWLHWPARDLVCVPNATTGVNIVARSLALQPGDEVLITNHEYGACERAWRFVCQQAGARLVRQPIALPQVSAENSLDQLWQAVTSRTRLIMISHISSFTAQCFPVAALCARARAAGILTLIDGAHAPGQIDLDLTAISADFYTGNCHKWLMAPKGSAFLAVRPEHQGWIEPLVVSWGWGDHPIPDSGSRLLNLLEWSGTDDPSAYLTVPAAIAFQVQHDWPAVRGRSHRLVQQFVEGMAALTGLPPLYAGPEWYHQMAIAPLSPGTDVERFKQRLYDQERVEMPCLLWEGQPLLRIAVQGYNDADDVARALAAIQRIIDNG